MREASRNTFEYFSYLCILVRMRLRPATGVTVAGALVSGMSPAQFFLTGLPAS